MQEEEKKQVSVEKPQKPEPDTLTNSVEEEEETDEFDFGGFPDDQPLGRNIGCGG